MSYRIFKRQAWQLNPSWPRGIEPLAMPMDKCRTIETVDTIQEARDYCGERNARRPYAMRMDETLSSDQYHSKMLAPFCEFTEI